MAVHCDSLDCHANARNDGEKAFTLAEVLITLVIIGVVAAITVPLTVSNVQKKVKTERISNIRHKFSKGTDAMLSAVGMNGYNSTMDFVQEFAKHFKISKICDNEHIADCWPTQTVNTVSKEKEYEWEINETKKATHLKMPKGPSLDWDDTVGIITTDGTGMILSYNKKCDKSATDGLHWQGDNSSSNTCVAAVFDWNGGKKPNRFGSNKDNDVLAINALGLGKACSIEIENSCFGSYMSASKLTRTDDEYLSSLGINKCASCKNDYWGGAAEACGGVQNLPEQWELWVLADKIYTKDASGKTVFNKEKLAEFGLPNKDIFVVWSKGERYMIYRSSGASNQPYQFGRDSADVGILCRM